MTLITLIVVAVQMLAAAERAPAPAQGPGVTRGIAYYDPTLQRVVLVAGPGQARAGDRDRVWSWTGARWEPMPDSGPAARTNAAAAYDARRRVAVVSGGARRSAADSTVFEVVAETWEQRAGAGWQRMAGSELRPLDHQSMVYDERRQAVLMFGGILGDRSVWPSETWELRPGGWVRVATEGPAGRGRTALAYDKVRRQVVLFGGVGAPPGPNQPQPFFNDTWVWDSTSWRKVAEGGPRARYAHGMVYDERAGVVLLYSGAAAHRGAPLSDMWQWDGRQWTEISLTGPTPGYRYQPIMVYDRARGKTVLYGGIDGGKDDTWEWDGRQWREIPR